MTIATDHLDIADGFLTRGHQYLLLDDLHQASEKGWGAAAHLAKAIAAARGWEYGHHSEFDKVIRDAASFYREPSLKRWGDAAHVLHSNYYQHPSLLDSDDILERLGFVEQMLDVMNPILRV